MIDIVVLHPGITGGNDGAHERLDLVPPANPSSYRTLDLGEHWANEHLMRRTSRDLHRHEEGGPNESASTSCGPAASSYNKRPGEKWGAI
jgi:hypothetical protein